MAHDPDFETNDARVARMGEVIALIEAWLRKCGSVEAAAAILDRHGVPNFKAFTVDDILHDPHAREAGWLQDLPLPPSVSDASVCPAVFGVADYSAGGIRLERAPELGEHGIEILMRCGLTREEAEAYEAGLLPDNR